MAQKTMSKAPIEVQVAAIAVAAAFTIMAAYFLYFGIWMKRDLGGASEWGQFGDYIGGLVNPVVGLATVILVVQTLKTTREEASETRRQLGEQTQLLREEAARAALAHRLAEIQKRLDGALSDWQTQMDLPSPELIRRDPNGSVVSRSIDCTSRSLLYDSQLQNELQALRQHSRLGSRATQRWHDEYRIAIGILRELQEYCDEYDGVSGDRKLTDYYRHRIQIPLRVLNAIGVIERQLFDGLRVGLKDMAFCQN